ncbi:hypothetical protein E4U53_007302 [Claviceps sorghi]|nr:hypothetical protein E4U53_007302 [Claviceps sorghi]
MPRSKRQRTGKGQPRTPPTSSSCPRSSPNSNSSEPSSNSSSPESSAEQVARIHAELIKDLGIANPSPALAERINTDARTAEAAMALVIFSREAHIHLQRLQTTPPIRPVQTITLRERMHTAEGIKAVTAARKLCALQEQKSGGKNV